MSPLVIFTIFKNNSEGQKLYLNPVIVDLIYCFTVSLNFALNTTWIFVWDREEIVTACAVLVFMAMTNVVALGIMARNVATDNHELLKSNPKLYW